MKSCKGCWHLSEGIFGPYCMVHGRWERETNGWTEKVTQVRVGHVETSIMRSRNGECGPDRKLYTTFWKGVWKTVTLS